MTPIHLGISTCPNDTFAFHGILEQTIDLRGLDFRVELLDIENINRRLFTGDFDVAKASFHAALLLAGELGVLPVGSALGFGVGPLLLAARPDTHPGVDLLTGEKARPPRVLCPGKHTTATLLYKLFHPGEGTLGQVPFSEIMPALRAGNADFGVCIHEGRFTWRQQRLTKIEDLGQVWEQETSNPLPLGGILARRRLDRSTIENVTRVLSDSLAYARDHRDETAPTMRRYAQDLTDEVMFQHVDLYVNQWTTDLGHIGNAALDTLSRKAHEVELLPPGSPALTLF